MRLKHLLFYLTVTCFINPVFSQNNGQLIEQSLDIKIPFTITQFSTKNGLPQSQVLHITPKGNGNLMIATASGILEYNGNEFSTFITGAAYKAQAYNELFWSERLKRLFARGSNGIAYQVHPEFKQIEGSNVFAYENDTAYFIDNEGSIRVTELATYTSRKSYETGVRNANQLFYKAGKFYISTRNGVFIYDHKSGTIKKLLDKSCHKFKLNPYNNNVYAIDRYALYKLNDSDQNPVINVAKYDKSSVCHDVTFTGGEDFFLATNKGLYEHTEDYTDYYSKLSSLPTIYLQTLYFDQKENCLFVGTGDKGLLKLQVKNNFSFSSAQGFGEASSLSSIIRTNRGHVLVTEPGGKIYKMSIDTVYPYIVTNYGLASLSEINNQLFLGTWSRGVYIYDEKTLVDSLTYPKQLPSSNIHASFQDSRGNIWIGTSNGISLGSTLKTIRPYLVSEIKGVIINFFELKNKHVCIGGSKGVYILNEKNKLITHLGQKEGLRGKEVRCFYEDAEGKLWIGTYGGGLYCYYKNKLTSINELRNAKLNIDIFCLAKDNYGYIYMTSNYGLWRVRENDLSDFYYNKLKYLIPFQYEEETGILNTEFNGGFQNNYLKTRFNHLYFPTLQGVVITVPEEPSFRTLEPVINSVLVNDTVYNYKNRVLERSTFLIEFNFSCTSFLSKYNVYYQYKLEGPKESEWSALQKNTSVSFKMLPPGKYKFSVRAIDALNDRTPKISSYSFEIKPYFYETVWFIVSAIVLFIALTIIIGINRVQNFRKKAEEKERVRRQMAELEMKAIQAQMNPHFIFNSLNSIKYYLSINDQLNADVYIDHFSKLLRDFLETGSRNFIALHKEKQIMRSYLELEKQRMHPSFDYELNCEEALRNVSIPTHLIQPFIENSIKHGINHSSKKCLLTLDFKKEGEAIVCTIEDNGIGREKAKEINKHRGDHTSKGVEIVLEKIRIVKEIYNLQIRLTIVDKYDNQGESTGTLVQLVIPIKRNENDNN